MSKSKPLFLLLFLLVSKLYCQKLIWSGTEDTNFFNETNWLVEGSNTAPEPNTINPLTAINRELVIDNANFVNADGIINLGSGSLSVASTNINGTAIQNGILIVNEGGYINLIDESALQNNTSVAINHPLSWLRL